MTTSGNELKRPGCGDVEDEDDGGDDVVGVYFSPPEVVIESDVNGTKKIISYDIDEIDGEGRRKKATTTIRIPKFAKDHLSKRGPWVKFGDAAILNNGSTFNMVCTKDMDIFLQPPRPRTPDTKAEDLKVGNRGLVYMVCRNCGMKKDHWTTNCPSKFISFNKPATDSAAPGPSKGADLPNQRQGVEQRGSEGVTNLSEDTPECNLEE